MKFNIKPIKFKFNIKGKYLYGFIIISIIIGLAITILFIYQSLHRVLAYSEEIIIMKQEIAPESFSVAEFERAIEKLEKKQTERKINWSKIKNPFMDYKTDISFETRDYIAPEIIELSFD